MSKRITLVDYGMANLLNVARAFEHCGAEVRVVEDPKSVASAGRLVVPGVGAFKDCIDEVNSRGFGDAIRDFVATGRPIFGICVGMQILFDVSEEFGEHKGLGILPGRVRAVPNRTVSGEPQRVPHIGWNHLVRPATGRNWRGTLLDGLDGKRPAVYFVHSFAADPADPTDRLADCLYGGHAICAAVQRGNLMATQFHPERSGETGLSLVRRFLDV
ncbi:imidazole glycerol phosphate synthase subunit HisH [Azospira restricta]|uniref:Imidazole glycerol phosphate synthase subunit HisH n=1 Tax=Azospira restricta TaxID=404405 RepID=A0A974SPG8_9RHOO|nr:imidazole glycerol phosphate synthase subunit HisH [Azospira restricta]QRJ64052.1 imidazole glycerol phosphate synthase subunit HisH [Azospira restricta]